MKRTRVTVWHNCYDAGWQGLIVPEAFAHPAKMARGLLERIFDHGQARGYWQPGATILDPFAGVLTTGIVGAYRGYRVLGVELEPRFVELAGQNIELHRAKLEVLGRELPRIVQGDSRKLREVVSEAGGVVGSPPYQNSEQSRDGQFTLSAADANPTPRRLDSRSYFPAEMNSPGQIGAMPEGSITSPPYAEGGKHTGGADPRPEHITGGDVHHVDYGESDGQIGRMPEGAVTSPPYADQTLTGERNFKSRFNERPLAKDNPREGYGTSEGQIGALTSPPYGASDQDYEEGWRRFHSNGRTPKAANDRQREASYGSSDGQIANMGSRFAADDDIGGAMPEGVVSSPPYEASLRGVEYNGIDPEKLKRYNPGKNSQALSSDGYGRAAGQIGADSGDTYWSAMALVYAQLYELLPPGGAAAIVVKDFVRKGRRVPLCDQTAGLLQQIGFAVPERCRAMLVKETTLPGLFGPVTQRTERKSFFRRLAEKKGSPAIDWEEVVWAVKGTK